MIVWHDVVVFIAGFGIGVIVCALLVRLGSRFFMGDFKKASNQALFDNSKQFMSLAEQYFSTYAKDVSNDLKFRGDQILQTVHPVRQTLDRYNEHLHLMEKDREKAYGAIVQQLMDMGRTQGQLQAETANLVKALRVPHVRGRWGEITLKRVADLSGMAEHCDFNQQASSSDNGKTVRPDMVITLPENRKIIVDSKVPLMAYLDALEAPDDQARQERLRHHAQQVLAHIIQLASKSYFEYIGPSPEFVVLFIPGENFFSAALSADPELIEKGVQRGVILATPTTLIALLKSVSYSWKQKKSYENAAQIRKLGSQLYDRLCTMAGNFNRLGKDIEKCVATYNRTVGAMETRVAATARQLRDLDVDSRQMEEPAELSEDKTRVKETKLEKSDEN